MNRPLCGECGQTIPELHRCTCGHLIGSHDLKPKTHARTRCSVHSGPRAERCPCAGYQEVTP